MTDAHEKAVRDESAAPRTRHRRELHARRAEAPQACGCGLAVAFDVERHEFFCIGCGNAKECVCRKSLLSSTVRPVNVV